MEVKIITYPYTFSDINKVVQDYSKNLIGIKFLSPYQHKDDIKREACKIMALN